jgi:hypothetical protein
MGSQCTRGRANPNAPETSSSHPILVDFITLPGVADMGEVCTHMAVLCQSIDVMVVVIRHDWV